MHTAKTITTQGFEISLFQQNKIDYISYFNIMYFYKIKKQ